MFKKQSNQATTSATSIENKEEDTIKNDNLLNLLQVKDTQVSFLLFLTRKTFIKSKINLIVWVVLLR